MSFGIAKGSAVLAVAALALAGCGSSTSATSSPAASGGAGAAQPTVYIIAPSVTDPFWITEKNGAEQAGKDFGVKVIFEAPAQDAGDAGMQTLAEAAVGAHPDGIAIDYTSKTMESVTTAALDAGIATVIYNNNRFEGDNKPSDARIPALQFVGQDESTSGVKLGVAFLPCMKSKGTVLLVNPFPTAFVLTLRRDGAAKSLLANGYTVADLAATGDQAQNIALISAYMQAHPGIVGMVGLGGPASNSAAKWASDNNVTLPIATFDVGSETATWITQGKICVAINQQPYLQSYFAVADLANQIKYGLVPANVDTGTQLVTSANIAAVQKVIAAGRG